MRQRADGDRCLRAAGSPHTSEEGAEILKQPPRLVSALEPLAPPIVLHCDPTIESVRLVGEDRAIVRTSDSLQVVDVGKGPIGKGQPTTDTDARPLRDWIPAGRKLISVRTGEATLLPRQITELVAGTPELVWGTYKSTSGPIRHFVHGTHGTTTFASAIDLQSAGEQLHGAFWSTASTPDKPCFLARVDARGEECVIWSRDLPGYDPVTVHPIGEHWLLFNSSSDSEDRILDTRTLVFEDLSTCAQPAVHQYTEVPPTAAIECRSDDQPSALWRPGRLQLSTRTLEQHKPPPLLPQANPRFLYLGRDDGKPYGRALHDRKGLRKTRGTTPPYWDSFSGKVVLSYTVLDDATAEEDEVGDDFSRTTLGLGDCPDGDWVTVSTFGNYRAVECKTTVWDVTARTLRKQPRRITSCGDIIRPPATRRSKQRLVDLRSGKFHLIPDAKLVGLSKLGVLAIRGSGHDVEGTDGTQLLLFPYPDPAEDR